MKKILFLLFTVLLISGCVSKTAETVDIKDDSVPSIYSVIGEKKITGTKKEANSDVNSVEISYAKGAISESELVEYTKHLETLGFILTGSYEENNDIGTWQLAKESITEDNIIIIDIAMPLNDDGVTIYYAVGVGSITRYE